MGRLDYTRRSHWGSVLVGPYHVWIAIFIEIGVCRV